VVAAVAAASAARRDARRGDARYSRSGPWRSPGLRLLCLGERSGTERRGAARRRATVRSCRSLHPPGLHPGAGLRWVSGARRGRGAEDGTRYNSTVFRVCPATSKPNFGLCVLLTPAPNCFGVFWSRRGGRFLLDGARRRWYAVSSRCGDLGPKSATVVRCGKVWRVELPWQIFD
jgi:hypothetical protein